MIITLKGFHLSIAVSMKNPLHQMLHEDRISKLPNDILISIISRLTLREATSTCILSTCWQHLHTYVSHLNFPKHRSIRRVTIDAESKYVSMVNNVLNSHRGSRIKELVVDMDIPECGNFEKWFEFALTKKAEIIRLCGGFHPDGPFLRLPIINGIECLKDLYLGSIKMAYEDFKHLISNCLTLECLRIYSSIRLKNVSIIGHSKLKHVSLLHGWQVEFIVIRDATSLISLEMSFLNFRCAIQLSNIPKLTKLSFGERLRNHLLVDILVGIPSCIRDQLQLVRLFTTIDSRFSRNDRELLWVDLLNIKHLELVLDSKTIVYGGLFSPYVPSFIEACLSLEKLVIKFTSNMPREKVIDINPLESIYYGRKCELSVKYLEITGYLGYSWQWELAMYVINNAAAFEKLTVVSCDQEALARARHDFRHTPSVQYDMGSIFERYVEFKDYYRENMWWVD